MGIKKIEIFDMDGCIVDSLHRYRTITDPDGKVRIDLQHWRDNEIHAMADSLLPLAKHYQESLQNPEIYVIIATARELKEPDFQFIREILGMPDHIIGRRIGDSRSGAALKLLGLRKLFSLKQFAGIGADCITFYEDNIAYLKAVCDAFKCKGVYISSNQGH